MSTPTQIHELKDRIENLGNQTSGRTGLHHVINQAEHLLEEHLNAEGYLESAVKCIVLGEQIVQHGNGSPEGQLYNLLKEEEDPDVDFDDIVEAFTGDMGLSFQDPWAPDVPLSVEAFIVSLAAVYAERKATE